MRESETNSLAASLLGVDELQKGKNLLAFSAGSDSTALFYLLLERNIPFDLVIVNYHLRSQSKDEVAYTKELAQKYTKKLFIKEAPLQGSNIEARARDIRYRFFEKLAKEHGYTHLITAHHLDDLVEWFFMQLTKGAGLVELTGMEPIQRRAHYTLVRPLLLTPKKEIETFLKNKKIKYFIDETNFDTSIKRNLFRHRFVKELMEHYAKGIAKSFDYLLKDKEILLQNYRICQYHNLCIAPIPQSTYEIKRLFDRMAKRVGYLLSSKQKEEMLRQKEGVIAGKFAFAITRDFLYFAPALSLSIPKKVRDLYRKWKIPSPLRPYFYAYALDPSILQECKDQYQNESLQRDPVSRTPRDK